jgi:hypothetical protein
LTCEQVQKGTSSTVTNTHAIGVKFGLKTKGKAGRVFTWHRDHLGIAVTSTCLLSDFIFAQAEVELSVELR